MGEYTMSTQDNRAEWRIRRHVATAPWPQIRIGDMPFTNQIRVSVWRRPSLLWRVMHRLGVQ